MGCACKHALERIYRLHLALVTTVHTYGVQATMQIYCMKMTRLVYKLIAQVLTYILPMMSLMTSNDVQL